MHATRRIVALTFGAALAAALVLSGCSASDDAHTGSGTAARAVAPAQQPETAKAQPQQAVAPDLGVDQRSIIYRGSLSVRVDNVDAAAGAATGIATTAGGFVGSDQRSTGGSGKDTATVELRVPAGKFSAVVDQLAKLGQEQQRQFSTEDVTEQVVDLDARIAVQQARVDSGRKLLAQAKSLNDLVMLEREVATREADLASLEAKKRRLADLTALSTITVVLLDPEAVAAQKEDGPPGFLAGLQNGWTGLLASLAILLTVLGWLLPWLLAIGLPAWGLLWLYRRYRPRRPARGALSAPASGIPAYAVAGHGPASPPPPAATYPPRPQPAQPAQSAAEDADPPGDEEKHGD